MSNNFIFEPDEYLNELRETQNPITATFYGRGSLTNEQAESLGFHRLPPEASVVDHINQATNVEHILPDGTRHFIPASQLKADPRNPDNLISAKEFTDEPEESNETNNKKRQERQLENQKNRSILNRGGNYRLIYYPGVDRNSRIGGVFKYYLKEEVPFSLAYYGIYKKSEEENLTKEQLNSNCLIDALVEYPKEQELLKYSHLNTYQILNAYNFNPICDIFKSNIWVYTISIKENQVRILKFPSNSIQCDYTKIIKICNHEEHFFPYVEDTGFLMSYIKKCGWKPDTKWKPTKQKKYNNYFNSINLVKHLLIQKEDYLIPKTIEENIEMENIKEKLRKEKIVDFPDYPVFNPKDCRKIKKFNPKKYCETPIFDPNHPNFSIKKLEDSGWLDDYSYVSEFINNRNPTKVLTKMDYLIKLSFKEIRIILELLKEENDDKLINLRNFIISLKDFLYNEEEFIEETTKEILVNKNLYEKCNYHINILLKLPNYNKNNEECSLVCDLETITDIGYHKPYLICWNRIDGSEENYRKGLNCCKEFIDYLRTVKENKINILCHNLSYEFSQLLRHVDMVCNSIEPRNNRVYKAVCYIFDKNKKLKKIVFSDTLAKIPSALSNFGKMFNLTVEKDENFTYCFYNNNTAFKDYIVTKIELYDDMKKLFDEKYLEIKDGKLIIKTFQCALDYCRRDVETLRQGWNKMREMVLELTGIDYNKVVTISRLAYLTCLKEGCYDGVVECRGKTETFIRNSLVGGRTMVALNNKKDNIIRILNEEENEEYQDGFDYNYENDTIYPEKLENKFSFHYSDDNVRKDIVLKIPTEKIIKKEICNTNKKFISPRPRVTKENYIEHQMFDECSLYSSGIVGSKGIPKGKPKTITKKEAKTKSFLGKVDEFFIIIRVLKVGKKYNNPMTNYLRVDGKRIWTNEIEGKKIFIDRVYLEILEKWHEIEWECLGGIYFNEGYNTKIIDLVKKLYEERLKYKKEKNPFELVLKLILNNMYGTNLMRDHEEKTKWITQKRQKERPKIYDIWDKYGIDNVEAWEITPKIIKLKIKNAFDVNHWSCCHWGGIILSESKRILAEHTMPVDEEILYGDTDSFVITQKGKEILKNKMPEIFGNGLGQIKLEHKTKSSNMYIEKGMFLAPKLYLLKEVDKDNGEVYWKATIKGIPSSSRDIVCRQKFNGNYLTMFYAMIYRENKVYFDLLNGGDRIRMDFSDDNQVSTVDEFFRKIGGYC